MAILGLVLFVYLMKSSSVLLFAGNTPNEHFDVTSLFWWLNDGDPTHDHHTHDHQQDEQNEQEVGIAHSPMRTTVSRPHGTAGHLSQKL